MKFWTEQCLCSTGAATARRHSAPGRIGPFLGVCFARGSPKQVPVQGCTSTGQDLLLVSWSHLLAMSCSAPAPLARQNSLFFVPALVLVQWMEELCPSKTSAHVQENQAGEGWLGVC